VLDAPIIVSPTAEAMGHPFCCALHFSVSPERAPLPLDISGLAKRAIAGVRLPEMSRVRVAAKRRQPRFPSNLKLQITTVRSQVE
jgi:hypothetical protein